MTFITIGDVHLKKSLVDTIEYKPTPHGQYKFCVEIHTSKNTYFAHFNTESEAKQAYEQAKKELNDVNGKKNYPDTLKAR